MLKNKQNRRALRASWPAGALAAWVGPGAGRTAPPPAQGRPGSSRRDGSGQGHRGLRPGDTTQPRIQPAEMKPEAE